MKVLVAQSRLTLWEPMDCSLPGSSAHGISQARILELVAISFSRASSQPRDQTWVFCMEWGAIAFSNLIMYYYTKNITIDIDAL